MSPHDADLEHTVERMARLARLSIPAHARSEYALQFARILAAFEDLTELDVEGVEPLTQPADLADVTRDDVLRPSLSPDQVLSNAPQRVEDFFGVPKTVGGDA